MAQEPNGDKSSKKVCPTCGKRISPAGRPGSLTSYLFGASECSCSKVKAEPQGRDFCPKCGLRIVHGSKAGSLTGFLFQDTRCKCPPDQAFADGKMSARFWKMKEAGSGTTFVKAAPESDKAGAGTINLAAGATIGGAYKIIQLIGAGGMGEVYLARHQTLGKKCALKVIPPEQVTEIGWQRFQLEAKAVAKLDHINLVRVTDLGIHEGCLPFYAMEYIEGTNLADLLAQSGPLPLATVLEIFMQVCDGVDCAHRSGMLHRDLKPANIMVQKAERGKATVKILDFGLAKLTSQDRSHQSLTAVGDVFGSPSYMSPEQCSGDRLDRCSDIYSLGCTMFECLTGQPPFTGHMAAAILFGHLEGDPPSLESIAGSGKFPAGMEVVMAKLLRKNPVERYQTLLELRGDLEKLARGEDVEPFYVSRAKAAAAAKDELDAKRKNEAQSGQKTQTPAARRLVLAVSSIFFILLPAGIAYRYFAERRPTTNQTGDQIAGQHVQDTNVAAPKSRSVIESMKSNFIGDAIKEQPPGQSVNDTKLYSTEITKAGRRMISFDFPSDFTVGTIQSKNIGHMVPARGHVEFPAGSQLDFVPDQAVAKYPQYLKRFRPGDISRILLGLSGPNDALIKAITNLKGLATVELKACDEIDDNCIPDLSQLNLFSELTVNYCGITGAGMARLPYLKQLKVVNFGGGEHAELMCAALAGSTSVQTLWLDGCFLPPSAFQDISTMTNLRTLVVDDSTMTDKELLALTKLPHLHTLFASHCNITASQAAIIKKFPSLKALMLGSDPAGAQAVRILRRTVGDVVKY